MNIASSFAKAYQFALQDLVLNPEYVCSPRGQKIKEILNYNLRVIYPYSNSFYNEVRPLPVDYLKKELRLYFSGVRDLKSFAEASKFWNKISDDKETVNSAYGYLIFVKENKHGRTQWDWAIKSLCDDADTRQAVMFLGGPDYQFHGVKDFVCTFTYQFFIRNDQVHMLVNRRSQDIILGLTFDAPWEMLLLQCVRKAVNNITGLNYGLGTYSLNCGSLHLYERNFELAEQMLQKFFEERELPKIDKLPILDASPIDDEFITWLKTDEVKT